MLDYVFGLPSMEMLWCYDVMMHDSSRALADYLRSTTCHLRESDLSTLLARYCRYCRLYRCRIICLCLCVLKSGRRSNDPGYVSLDHFTEAVFDHAQKYARDTTFEFASFLAGKSNIGRKKKKYHGTAHEGILTDNRRVGSRAKNLPGSLHSLRRFAQIFCKKSPYLVIHCTGIYNQVCVAAAS